MKGTGTFHAAGDRRTANEQELNAGGENGGRRRDGNGWSILREKEEMDQPNNSRHSRFGEYIYATAFSAAAFFPAMKPKTNAWPIWYGMAILPRIWPAA